MTTRPIVELIDLHKRYRLGAMTVEALHGVNLRIEAGEFVSIIGPSGSGKSTLMNILGCLDSATSGVYELDGVDVSEMDETRLAHVRNRRVGFVFQQFNLLASLSAWRNVEMPLIYSGVARVERKERALRSLQRVNLGDRVDHRPSELSGGQQQRVAVARALVNEPSLVLADEPTGNLDSASATDVLSLLGELNASGRTVILITHDVETAQRAERVVRIRDGEIQSDESTAS
ncbi:MAG TPA: ABC transporter ATP-binding protein [Acidimicrobiales bacterium]|nr:ABC transporter ATP-binding protein [Acidimicrobiales bacterium]